MLSSYAIQPARVIRAARQRLPDVPGVYAMLLDDPGSLAPALERANLRLDPLRLGRRAILYLGATEDSLRRRLKCHLSDDTYRSTFRMSLGAVLAEELGLKARASPYDRHFGFEPESETLLSAWIEANVSIAIRASCHALAEEKSLIAAQNPLLNITGRHKHPSAGAVLLLRQRIRGLRIDPRCLH